MRAGRPKKGETGGSVPKILELHAKGIEPGAIAIRLGLRRNHVVEMIKKVRDQEGGK
jgi:hypothetical protein